MLTAIPDSARASGDEGAKRGLRPLPSELHFVVEEVGGVPPLALLLRRP